MKLLNNTQHLFRKAFLLIAFLFSLQAFAQTGTYHPFPDSNAYWNFREDAWCNFVWQPVWVDYSIVMTGDTVIGAYTYHKIEVPYMDTTNWPNCFVPDYSGYNGAFREDTVQRKLYYFPSWAGSEILYFDFNLQIGDTVFGYLSSFVWDPEIVLDIDSVNTASGYRKRWLVNSQYNVYVIEGIGSTYGLVQPSPGNTTDLPYFTLNCFNQDQVNVYQHFPGSNCQLITGVPAIESQKTLNIFPNPADTECYLTIPLKQGEQLIIRDLIGREVSRIGSSAKVIATDQFPTGCYLVTLEGAAEPVSFKLLVQHQ